MKRVALTLMLPLLLACGGESRTAETGTGAPSAAVEPRHSPEAIEQMRQALTAYESARATLAADSVQGIGTAAGQIEQAAATLAASGPADLRDEAESLVTAATQLSQNSGSIEKARASFGEVSRAIITLVSEEPALVRDHYVFECPMVSGYKRWVQKDTGIANPYMGKSMLKCGSRVTWEG